MNFIIRMIGVCVLSVCCSLICIKEKITDKQRLAIKKQKERSNELMALSNGQAGNVLVNLYKGDVDPNIRDEKGMTPLHHAVSRGDIFMTKCLLSRFANPNIQRNGDRYTPLHVAVQMRSPLLVKLLLKAPDIDPSLAAADDCDRNTPLHMAVKGNHPLLVRFLVSHESTQVNARNFDYETYDLYKTSQKDYAVSLAKNDYKDSDSGRKKCAKDFKIFHGLERLCKAESLESTPLSLAIELGYSDCAKELLKSKNIQIHCTDEICIKEPLCLCICYDREDLFKTLLERDDIDVNRTCDRCCHRLPIVLAVTQKCACSYLEQLLAHQNIDVNRTRKGETVLDWAQCFEKMTIRMGLHIPEKLKLLGDAGAKLAKDLPDA